MVSSRWPAPTARPRVSQAFRELDAAHQALLTVAARQAAEIAELREEVDHMAQLSEEAGAEVRGLRLELSMARSQLHGVVLRQSGDTVVVARKAASL